MHIVAAKPQFLKTADVPAALIEKETAIFREQSEQQGANNNKKPEMFEKIIQGKVNKRLGEISLLEQVCVFVSKTWTLV